LDAAWFVPTRLARDRSALLGLVLIGLLVVSAVLAPVLATHPDDVFELHPAERLRAPGPAHWLGTDRMGADVYSRLLFGARITILIGVIAVGASLLVGVPIGLVAGYYHGWFSDLLMRVSDVFLAVPQVVLAIAIAQTLGPSLPNVILALSATYWPWFARVVYAETRTLQKEVFVESTAALGASPWRLTALHVLPNIASPIIVRASIGMGFTILTAAALGFLGLGPPPPTPEWGRTIAESRAILGILPTGAARIRGGEVRFKGVDLLREDPAAVNDRVRGRAITFIPQDPYTSFSPVFPVQTQIMDLMKWKSPRADNGGGARSPFRRYPRERWRADREAVLETLRAVQIPEPTRALRRLPHEFSGGQRQRLMIAMALLP